MNYSEIEKFFEANKYEEILDLYKEDLERAEEYSNLFSNNALVTPNECQEALDVLTGLFMKFNTIYHIADYQYEKKKQICKIASGNKDSLSAICCLRVKSIFKAYMDNCKRAISSCQSLLKYYIRELELTK